MIDLLYLTWNRIEFTKFTFGMLLRNTDWSLVNRLVIHDDRSEDGTPGWLRKQFGKVPVPVELNEEVLRSPPAVMNRIVASTQADWFAKIDNDIVVPPGWLRDLLGVVERNPEIELLGMEAGRMGPPGHNGSPWDGVYVFEPGTHIGGVGLMRVATFATRPKMREDQGRFGFTEFQHEYPGIIRGWINPDLLVCSLDQVPSEPWQSLTQTYVENDWQRPWPPYHARWPYYWEWWDENARARAEAM